MVVKGTHTIDTYEALALANKIIDGSQKHIRDHNSHETIRHKNISILVSRTGANIIPDVTLYGKGANENPFKTFKNENALANAFKNFSSFTIEFNKDNYSLALMKITVSMD